MQLLGADADLRSETELETVRKTGGCVDVHARRIHLPQELLRVRLILRQNGIGMPCVVLVDMGDRSSRDATVFTERIRSKYSVP